MKNSKTTGYPSIDKPWLKYYSQEIIDAPLPECTIYEHIFNNNQDNLDRIALVYYGSKISYRQIFQEISYIAGTLEDNGLNGKNSLRIRRKAKGHATMQMHQPSSHIQVEPPENLRGQLLSNKAIIAVAQQYIIGERELRRESIWMQVLPLFIAYGVTCSLMIPLTVGMTLVVRIPMSESIADFYKKFKPNHIMYGPAYWEAFADANENLDLSNLIAPITGGDVLHSATEAKINDYLKKHGSPYLLMNGYGMTDVICCEL